MIYIRANCTRPVGYAIILVIFISIIPRPASANDPKRITIKPNGVTIKVDGLLDEPDWDQGVSIGEILQREPVEGAQATERTEVKILASNDNLYIGVMCYDSDPHRIVSTRMQRDAMLESDDRIEILLDTFHDRRNAFYFATNPAGALVDGLIIENGRFPNLDWNAIWEVHVKRSDQGWSAEFSIPFKSLSFTPGSDTWGFNISRYIVRKLEEDRWASPRLDVLFTQVSEAGVISGFSQSEQGKGLDVRPFAIGRWNRDEFGKSSFDGDVGADIFYNITPGLKLTTTINTDFAETEVDDRQINTTRFPLFFPEKRAFFLENAGVFSFSRSFGRRTEVMPFFSRRIGLLEGTEIPILGGAKLTGKAGKYDIGAMAIRTRDAFVENSIVPAKNFFVGRVKRNIFSQSYIGGIITDGNPGENLSSRMFGTDMRLSTSNFLGTKRNFSFDTFLLKTANEGVSGDDISYGFYTSYPNDKWEISTEYSHLGSEFDPKLGFVARPATDKIFTRFVYKPRPKNFLNVRQMSNEFLFWHYRRNDIGSTESWRLFFAPVNWDFNSGDRIEVNWLPTFERLFVPFEIADGVILPPGDYHFNRYRAEFRTATKRRWEAEMTWWFGTFFSGRSDEIRSQFTYKIAPRFRIAFQAEQNFVTLKEGNFVARIFSLRTDYAFSTFMSFSNLVQYDNESRNMGWQSRLRWILRPGNDLFLVFNQGWIQDDRGGFNFRSANTRFAGKLQYTFRF